MFANCVPWPKEELNAAVQSSQTQVCLVCLNH